MDALKTAARQTLANQKKTIREIVTGLDATALNWKPLNGQDTNSLAAMFAHAMDAERYHVASALGITLERDREKWFRFEAESDADLLALIDQAEADVNGWIDRLTAEHLATEMTSGDRTYTGAWWLLHAIEHVNEHVGQGLLTRQWYEAEQQQ